MLLLALHLRRKMLEVMSRSTGQSMFCRLQKYSPSASPYRLRFDTNGLAGRFGGGDMSVSLDSASVSWSS